MTLPATPSRLPDTESLKENLKFLSVELERMATDPATPQFVSMAVSTLAATKKLRNTWRSAILQPRLDLFRSIITRAIDRGEIADSVNPDIIVLLFSSAFLFKFFLGPDMIPNIDTKTITTFILDSVAKR